MGPSEKGKSPLESLRKILSSKYKLRGRVRKICSAPQDIFPSARSEVFLERILRRLPVPPFPSDLPYTDEMSRGASLQTNLVMSLAISG